LDSTMDTDNRFFSQVFPLPGSVAQNYKLAISRLAGHSL
jgi:hypothetical protein